MQFKKNNLSYFTKILTKLPFLYTVKGEGFVCL